MKDKTHIWAQGVILFTLVSWSGSLWGGNICLSNLQIKLRKMNIVRKNLFSE